MCQSDGSLKRTFSQFRPSQKAMLTLHALGPNVIKQNPAPINTIAKLRLIQIHGLISQCRLVD